MFDKKILNPEIDELQKEFRERRVHVLLGKTAGYSNLTLVRKKEDFLLLLEALEPVCVFVTAKPEWDCLSWDFVAEGHTYRLSLPARIKADKRK